MELTLLAIFLALGGAGVLGAVVGLAVLVHSSLGPRRLPAPRHRFQLQAWELRQLVIQPEGASLEPDLRIGDPKLDAALFIMAPRGLRAEAKALLSRPEVLARMRAVAPFRLVGGTLSVEAPRSMAEALAEALETAASFRWIRFGSTLGLAPQPLDEEGLLPLEGRYKGVRVRLTRAIDCVIHAWPDRPLPRGLFVVGKQRARFPALKLDNPVLSLLVAVHADDEAGAQALLNREDLVEPLAAVLHAYEDAELNEHALVLRAPRETPAIGERLERAVALIRALDGR